ncbi:uncharacterized protein TNCT_114891 [Trichonephila clavata]|uniref:Uncharacterized protein n=1 Tax=Trichonephila clavata TaxID=2740835 RepID=A0A8X6LZ78_TRICU|nr:uncharacterized protein TNCT_114891 [Trichonephila clavata]
MDPMESQSFPNEEMFSLQSSPTLLPSNIEPFESPLLFQLHSSNEHLNHPMLNTEIHPADLKTGDEPVSVHYISPHDTISTIPTQRLSHYVTVTGNQHRNLFFLALRFKNPVIIQKHFGFSSCTLQMPKETCLLVDVNCPTLKLNLVEPTLLFTFQTRQGKSPTECELLQMLFPKNSLVVMQCYVRTLFVVSRCNPFQSMWTRIRKNGAFQGLERSNQDGPKDASGCHLAISTGSLQFTSRSIGANFEKGYFSRCDRGFYQKSTVMDQYPELYRSSSSFLDFLFKLCNVPSSPSPYCQGEDLQKRLASKERELVSLQETLREKGYFMTQKKGL